MDKKGLAVSQIVLLVLGILVLAVVAYLLYTNFLTSSGSFNAEKCRSEEIGICTTAKLTNSITDGKVTAPRGKTFDTPSCVDKTPTSIDCKSLGIE